MNEIPSGEECGKRILTEKILSMYLQEKSKFEKKKFLSVDRQRDKNIINAMSNGHGGRKCNSEKTGSSVRTLRTMINTCPFFHQVNRYHDLPYNL